MINSSNKNKFAWLLILLLLSTGIPVQAQESELEQFTRQSRQNIVDFKTTLDRARRLEIESIGLFATAEICRATAPQLYHEFAVKNQIVLHRVSLTPRNIITGHADAWEQAGLLKLRKMIKDGKNIDEIEIVELVQVPAGKYYRYISPLIAESGCMKCHGTENEINKEAAESIRFHYPDDQATGYQVGV